MIRKNAAGKVTVRFPPGHPVLEYPPGQISDRVRHLVDVSLQIEKVMQPINQQLAQMNARLERLESLLESGVTPKEKPLKTEKAPNIIFDLDAFANEL